MRLRTVNNGTTYLLLLRVLHTIVVLVLWLGSGTSALHTNMPRRSYPKTALVQLVKLVQTECRNAGDPEKARSMQAYVKSSMPMYGIQKPQRAAIEKKMHASIQELDIFMSQEFYRDCIQSLWDLPHREEKYLAIDFALLYKEQICFANLSVFETMIRDDSQGSMWWDFVDPIAVNLIGRVALTNKSKVEPKLRQWIDDDSSMWMRRTALLSQLKHKEQTNADLLLEFCRKRMHEKELFIRKAIGWALREYSKTNPDCVMAFLKEEKANLSGLSYREGSKHLVKEGIM